jgi:hypothetical protein
MVKPEDRVEDNASYTQNDILTEYEVTTEPQDHLARSLTRW